jgi:hypothetical protein
MSTLRRLSKALLTLLKMVLRLTATLIHYQPHPVGYVAVITYLIGLAMILLGTFVLALILTLRSLISLVGRVQVSGLAMAFWPGIWVLTFSWRWD